MAHESDRENILGKAFGFLRGFGAKKREPEAEQEQQGQRVEPPCCDPESTVHIAYRAVSDDHLYMARNRKWHEMVYFKPRGLRVFCAKCRHRLY